MRQLQGEPLAALTSMRVGGPAARLVVADTTDELVDAVREVDDADEPLFVLGGGSNVVIADAGLPGTVVKVATGGIRVDRNGPQEVLVTLAAGEVWDQVVTRAVDEGWAGIEALSGIPGSAGATPIQNVGAYGQEIAQRLAHVLVWDREQQRVHTMDAASCAFSYRHSLFKATDRYVVLEVTLRLERGSLSAPVAYADLARQLGVEAGGRVPLTAAREAVLAQRRRRGMVLDEGDHDTWSCGSFFTNPILSTAGFEALCARVAAGEHSPGVVPPRYPAPEGQVKTSAAWLIEQAGFHKGFGLPGPAALSTKHTLALTNRGGASARDVLDLARTIRDGVQAAFGIVLVNEPVTLGCAL